MSKNHKLKELTLKMIGENELSRKKLLEEIRKQSNISDKTLNEILMSFLKEGKIYITGYDFDVYDGIKRIQSIKADGIIFSVIKTDPLDINILINQLESDDPTEVKNASHKLKIIFRGKIDEMENSTSKDLNTNNKALLFNRIIYYLNTQPQDQKTVLKNKLAWSLSSEKGSTDLLKNLINYIESQSE
ncbi:MULTISPECIES: hypothetical protein [Methanobacterium]|uniref:Uncharacterized protein n=1 Tax=Methanobacterium bryantii TaxID=2161 RepID=A0A2A2H4P0_METBR|nr:MULTISPECIES: hypothetical protein [Methanobacterium]OEC84693.1 hypothetical protein A9507_15060 [Methanobacterium sp. A39]PAV04286.1 hypothetical protein ASJ80_05405 [Methanobacterium bryantii]